MAFSIAAIFRKELLIEFADLVRESNASVWLSLMSEFMLASRLWAYMEELTRSASSMLLLEQLDKFKMAKTDSKKTTFLVGRTFRSP